MISLFLSKLLPIFVYPVGLAILAGIAALVLSIVGFVRTSRVILTAGVALLWIASTPLFANWLYSQLEAKYPPVTVEALPRADVVIVLGGAVGQPLPPRITADASEAVDRVLHAARIFHAGKGETILVSGGNLPWRATAKPEAELIAELLVELSVPRLAIALETESRNTRENAVNSAKIIKAKGWQSVILVTSGAHMPRALVEFRRAGVDAMPATTDIRVSGPLYQSVLDLFPTAASLAGTTDALKEYLGSFVYKIS